jgi:hypothetical protein
MFDPNNKRLLIQSNADGSVIKLGDEKGDPRIGLVAQSSQSGLFMTQNGSVLSEWKTTKDGASLEFFDLKPQLRLFVGIDNKSPKMQINDAEGGVRFLKP